jgi:hypothetical protein
VVAVVLLPQFVPTQTWHSAISTQHSAHEPFRLARAGCTIHENALTIGAAEGKRVSGGEYNMLTRENWVIWSLIHRVIPQMTQ